MFAALDLHLSQYLTNIFQETVRQGLDFRDPDCWWMSSFIIETETETQNISLKLKLKIETETQQICS